MSQHVPGVRWQGASYARHSGHHRAADEWFLRRHLPSSSDVVVDLGCGTGEFSARLAALVPHGRVIGVDRDESMLEQARGREGENLHFIQAPAEHVDEVVDAGSVDLVVSRAMLHWLPAVVRPQYFRAVLRVLKPGGVLHAEGAGTGNIRAIDAMLGDLARRHGLPEPPPFPDTGVIFDEVEEAGFEIQDGGVHSVAQRRSFTTDELEGLLRTQAILVLTRHASAELAAKIEHEAVGSIDRLRRYDGSFDQTFVRLDVLARRPAPALGDH